MKADRLLEEILLIIRTVKDDEKALQKILDFLVDEIDIPGEEEEEIQLPDKYTEVVKQIADSINAGLVCFLNMDTLETDEFPQELISSPGIYEMNTGMTLDEFNPRYTHWKNYVAIEPLELNESFEIMEKFADQLADSRLKTQLANALNNRKPFANFKRIIDNSDMRQEWFDFKNRHLQNYVKSIIEIQIQE
jgi:hypothetical protein